eukprot:scaffold180437_cov19-Prasinocladus_malaysianus.AAC.1
MTGVSKPLIAYCFRQMMLACTILKGSIGEKLSAALQASLQRTLLVWQADIACPDTFLSQHASSAERTVDDDL